MKIKIDLLSPFSDAVGKKELNIEFQGATLKELIEHLVEEYPKLKKDMYSESGEITDYLSILVNDQPAHDLNKTGLKDGDELLFFFPISGG